MAPPIDPNVRSVPLQRQLDDPAPAVAPAPRTQDTPNPTIMGWNELTQYAGMPGVPPQGDAYVPPAEPQAKSGSCEIAPSTTEHWKNLASLGAEAPFGWADREPEGRPFEAPQLEGAKRNPATGAMEYYGQASPSGTLQLAWDPPSPLRSANADVKYYELSWETTLPGGTVRRGIVTVPGPDTKTKAVTNLIPGQRYCFRIRAAYYAKAPFQYTDPATGQQRTATPGTIIMSGYGVGADGRPPCKVAP